MKFQAIVAPTITELFERQIQGMILSGQMVPGEKLPTEAELAENMHISKSAVHAGVKNLEHMGFIKISPRHGVYVADYAETGNVDTLIALLKYHGGRLDKHTSESLLEARGVLEGLAMKRFIEKRTEEDIKALEDIVENFKITGKAKPHSDELAELICSFHRYICSKCGNNVVPLIVNGFHDVNIALWSLWVRQTSTIDAVEILNDFIYFIKVRNANEAVALMKRCADDFVGDMP